jgi:hypothetical protein
MMQSMMDCGGWLMMGFGILLTLLLGLGVAALIKYLFFGASGSKTERSKTDTDSLSSRWHGDELAPA